uniref:Uncharacterized protein n=1 Tax=Candidatus Kentrum eta TaxID=2126337 RepID=A0A450V2X9_9GAMM|nr:MAG: hypothetical protein BECKH772A_GA0070896_101564 [Candidatus Kentron sp. H]
MADPVIHGLVSTIRIAVIQGNQVDSLDHSAVFARPKISDKGHLVAVGLVRHAIVHAQDATFQVQSGLNRS